MMVRKHTAIIFLTVAYMLLLGHNIIPHHHHSSEEELIRHHQSHHHHSEGEDDSNNLGHLLSHFIHPDDGIATKANRNILNTQLSRLVISFAELPGLTFINRGYHSVKWQIPDTEYHQGLLYHTAISGLRAPPLNDI